MGVDYVQNENRIFLWKTDKSVNEGCLENCGAAGRVSEG